MLIFFLTVVQYLHIFLVLNFFIFLVLSFQNTTPLRLPLPNKKSLRSIPLETILKILPCHAMFALTNKTI